VGSIPFNMQARVEYNKDLIVVIRTTWAKYAKVLKSTWMEQDWKFAYNKWCAPKFLIRPTWGSKYVKLWKDGTWGPLPTSSTKGGKRGMLEVPGLD
jgi:hypothetical protein